MRGTSVFVAALVVLTTGAYGQVRFEPRSPFIDQRTDPAAAMLFGSNGYFRIAGGVVLDGAAVLYLEANGTDRAIPADQVRPLVNPGGSMSLRYEGADYRVGMPAGLACPLGRFVARDGFIAYTVPKYMDPDSMRLMMRAGLRHHRVAREFDGTRFEALLRAADFASTTPLPDTIEQHLTTSLNDADGMRGFVIDAADAEDQPIGSLINTDIQVTYHVYLMQATQQVEIGGVPLRYFGNSIRMAAPVSSRSPHSRRTGRPAPRSAIRPQPARGRLSTIS